MVRPILLLHNTRARNFCYYRVLYSFVEKKNQDIGRARSDFYSILDYGLVAKVKQNQL